MPETSVRYDTRKGAEVLPIRFLGPRQNFVLKTEPISHRLSANIPPRQLDLLEIAAAVFCADSTVSRGTLVQPRHGETWRRTLEFTFAVRDIHFWQQHDVTRTLRHCIEFMTDDEVSCEFVEIAHAPQVQDYLDLKGASKDAFRIDDVILFSGGLDSLAGTLDVLAKQDRRVALVTHRSATKTMRQQDRLIKELRKDFREQLLWFPVRVHRKGQRRKESTQRSRSLLFAAIGSVVAHMLSADRIQFYENGVVSQNLPVAVPINGTLATRTTHPQTLAHLEDFLSLVAAARLAVSNPFQWMTKTEVVGQLKANGQSDLIPLTVSCNHTFKRKSNERHCGACTQCLDRRFSLLANDLGAAERADDYATGVLFGTHARDDEKSLTAEWVRHASRLSLMSVRDFEARFVNELLRIARPFADRQDAIERAHQMHRRHGTAVMSVLANLSKAEVASAPIGSLAATFGRRAPILEAKNPVAELPEIPATSVSTKREAPPPFFLQIARHDDGNISVLGLQDFTGVHARLISVLLKLFVEDREAGMRLEQYRGLKGRELGDCLDVSEDYIRTEISRIRETLRDSWRVVVDGNPPKDILIKTNGQRGYRLDPNLNVVAANYAD